MYVEFNESENPERDWELSVEFYPEEQAEYEFYVAAQREVEVCQESAQNSRKPQSPQSQRVRCTRTPQNATEHLQQKKHALLLIRKMLCFKV